MTRKWYHIGPGMRGFLGGALLGSIIGTAIYQGLSYILRLDRQIVVNETIYKLSREGQ